MAQRPQGNKGLFAATALTKVMSGNMTTGMTIEVGTPGYDPVRNVLRLPGIPADDVPEDVLDRLLAYLGHEAAERGRSTWMPNDKRWAGNAELKGLVNAINDARIDLEQSEEYPGFGMKMKAVRTAQAKKLVREYRDGNARASFGTIGMLCVFIGEKLMTFEQALKLFPKWEKFLRRGERVMRVLDVSTEEKCIAQAMALYNALQPPSERQQEPPAAPAPGAQPPNDPLEGEDPDDDTDMDTPSGNAGDSQDELDEDKSNDGNAAKGGAPDENESEETSDDDNDGAGDGGGQQRPDDVQGTDDAAASDGADSDDGSAAGGGAGGDDDADAEPATDSDADAAAGEPGDTDSDGADETTGEPNPDGAGGIHGDDEERLASNDEGDVQSGLLDEIVDGLFKKSKWDSGQASSYTFDPSGDVIQVVQQGQALSTTEYARAAQVLETKMRQVLTAPAMKYMRDRDRGELDERAIGRFVAGDEFVFRRRVRQESDSVAVSLSWDESSSMARNRISVVKRLAYTFNESLGKLNIAHEQLGWSTGGRPTKNRKLYRTNGVQHNIYKGFNDRWNDEKVLRRLGNISTRGSTPLVDGLMFSLDRLGRRLESRRILFFATDGQPDGGNGPARITTDIIATLLRRAETAGIEVIGIGIQIDISKLFPVSFKVNKLQEMQGIAVEELLRILKSTKRTVF